MRATLKWGLAATLGLTALALWRPSAPRGVVAAVDRGAAGPAAVVAAVETGSSQGRLVLPASLPELQLEPARRDPFSPVPPPVARPATAAPVAAPSPPPPTPAPPVPVAPPPPPLRYLGSMLTPQGQRLDMLARGDVVVPVQVGTVLDGGYVVRAIDATAISLVYPPTNTLVSIPVSEPASPYR
jgi:hypothetical protein